MLPKLLVFENFFSYADPFKSIFEVVEPKSSRSMLDAIQKADCVLFTGGADISPTLYGDVCLSITSAHPQRDLLEEVIMRTAIANKKGILGICRGAQLACAMAGGKLYQDVRHHNTGHDVKTYDGKEIYMTSLHHQMMIPDKTNHMLLAWSIGREKNRYTRALSLEDWSKLSKEEKDKPCSIVEEDVKGKVEPDTVFFKDIKALGFQGHPEMFDEHRHKESLAWVIEQTKKFLID